MQFVERTENKKIGILSNKKRGNHKVREYSGNNITKICQKCNALVKQKMPSLHIKESNMKNQHYWSVYEADRIEKKRMKQCDSTWLSDKYV